MDRSEAIELSLRNRERALKKFDSERSARELIQVFEKTCIYHDFLGFAAMVGNQNIIEFVRGLGSLYVERGVQSLGLLMVCIGLLLPTKLFSPTYRDVNVMESVGVA